jgi:hypothetical protein
VFDMVSAVRVAWSERDEGGTGRSGPRALAAAAPASDYFDQPVSRFLYRWGGLLSSALIRIRRRFDGDLDQYLLYLIFLLADLSQVVSRADAEARGERAPPWVDRGMNALSLSDITLIPRETTRRKLQALVANDYLRRSPDGLYRLGDRYGLDAFFADLSPLFRERPDATPARGG